MRNGLETELTISDWPAERSDVLAAQVLPRAYAPSAAEVKPHAPAVATYEAPALGLSLNVISPAARPE
jgi:hypothetical protein